MSTPPTPSTPPAPDRDYILGTHDAEIDRLGFQHRTWRSVVLDTWRRAGIATGSRVLDIGAGPGFASLDLAEIVGPTGHVTAVERSARYAGHLRAQAAARAAKNITVVEADLMTDALPASGVDATWCRWVASFVSSRQTLVQKISAALRPGGVAVFHEYVQYETYALLPHRPAIASFVQEVMASWRTTAGEPNVANELLALLPTVNLELIEANPKIFAAAPNTDLWNWPAGYVQVGAARLKELGRVTDQWEAQVLKELHEAESNPRSRFMTPMVLEIIARKP